MVKRSYSTPGGTPRSAKRMRSTPTPAAKRTIGKIAKQTIVRMAEKKIHRQTVSEVPISSATLGNIWTHLSAVSAGSGYGSRTGKEITLQRLKINGLLHNNSTGTHVVRCVIGYHRDPSVAPSTGTELFEGTTPNAGPITGTTFGPNGVEAILVPINKAKFTVLSDRLYKLGANGSIDGNQVRTWTVDINLRDAKVHFEGNTEGADNQDKNLYIGFWTAEGGNDVGAGTSVESSYVSSLHYLDM